MTRIADRWPQVAKRLPHLDFVGGPSPVRQLPSVGPEVWVKDDSLIGEHYGGNKIRKLEWSLAALRHKGVRTVLTAGGLGTNHGLATALYAKQLGMKVVLLLVDQPMSDEVQRNLDAMRAAGASIVTARSARGALALAPLVLLRNTRWRAPGVLPIGGSNPAGVLGFVEAGLELAEQVEAGLLPAPKRIVVAVGSGGSAAGLLLGCRLAGLNSEITGILVNDKTRITEQSMTRMAIRSANLLRKHGAQQKAVKLPDLTLDRRFLGQGYGYSTTDGDEATELFAADGIRLDPVYTAKAGASMLAREVGAGPTLFWHTHSDVALESA